MEKVSEFSNSIMLAGIGFVATIIGWFVRRVLTDSKKVAILEAERVIRDKQREQDRQDLRDVKEDIRDIKMYIMEGKR